MSDINTHPENHCKDVQNQTAEEWWRSHDKATKYRQASNTPVSLPKKPSESLQQKDTLAGDFLYIGHRTTKQGRLVLEFVHKETGYIACRFFNVDIQSARTSRMYRVGNGGQFTTRKGHRFRRFWLYAFSDPPYRWSRVHHELHRLKTVPFIGTAELRHTTNGSYWNLTDLRKKR